MRGLSRKSGVLTEARRRDRYAEQQDEAKLARERRSFKRAIRPRPVMCGNARRLLNGQVRRGGRDRCRVK